jgi:hypothetical protein
MFNIDDFVHEISLKSDMGLNLVVEVATQNIHFKHKEIYVGF